MPEMSHDELRRLAGNVLAVAEDRCMMLPSGPCEFENDVCKLAEAAPALLNRVAKLEAAVRELLPFARTGVQAVNDTLVGSLYPSINLAVIDRAESALADTKGGGG